MAITRCPYCHAIIDENDKYCNNCGTQLLFSEDEEIEEEIPGEKIVDAEVEEKDYTVNEPEDEKRPAPAKDLDSEIDEELAQELREETEELALDELVAEEARKAGEDDVTEEVILVDEIEAAGSKTAEPKAGDDEEKEKDEDEEDDEEEEDEEEEKELADELEDEKEDEAGEVEPEKGTKEPPRTVVEPDAEEETREYAAAALKKAEEAAHIPEAPVPSEDEPVVEYVSEIAAPDEAATAGEAAFRSATFDTKEFENLGRTVELSKEKVDKFLEDMSEKRPPAPPPALEPLPAAAPIPQTGSLPPWASTMKGAPVFSEDTGSVETRKFRGGEPATSGTEEEVEIFPRRRAADSTIGLPEKVSQSPLPFGAPAPGEEAEDEDAGDEAAEETKVRDLTPEKVVLPAGQVRPFRAPAPAAAPGGEIEAPDEREEPEPRPPFSFSVFFKSKAFDVLFVGLFWLVALGLAASSLGVTLFAILGSMSGPMLLLYAVFVLIYFFLFKFFLGETLGDRLFRPRE